MLILASLIFFVILIFKVRDHSDLSALSGTGPTTASLPLLLVFNLLSVVGHGEQAVLLSRLPDVQRLVGVI